MTEETIPTGLVRIGESAPDFVAETTHGKIKLSDYKGKWVVLFSHPADFTPVCTTEFIAFAKRTEEFAKRNVQLIGLSIDSVFSHIAWVRSIKQNFDVDVKFPVIADLDMNVATKFGLIHPAVSTTAAVRAVFIIDDTGTVRALVYYPSSTGRVIDEFLRIVDALQTADKHGVATPESWMPGDKVIVPPPTTTAEADERVKTPGIEITDWYFSKKEL